MVFLSKVGHEMWACVLWALVFKSYNVRHISNESEQFFKQLAAHNSSQYLTLDFHLVFLSPLPPPFNVDLACVQDHMELKQKTSRCQHWFWGERGARKKLIWSNTHTHCRSRSGHDITVMYLFSCPVNLDFGDSDYGWTLLHIYSSNVKYWLVMFVKNARKAVCDNSMSSKTY